MNPAAEIEVGLTGATEIVVGTRDTAPHVGSGKIKVLATPVMVSLMEEAALNAVEGHLPPGFQTVGTRLDITHVAATPVGLLPAAADRGSSAELPPQALSRKDSTHPAAQPSQLLLHQRAIGAMPYSRESTPSGSSSSSLVPKHHCYGSEVADTCASGYMCDDRICVARLEDGAP